MPGWGTLSVVNSRDRLTNGWPLVGWAVLAIGAMVAAILARRGATPAGLGMLLGMTAVTSTVLFLGAFTASGLRVPWLVRNRRYLGVSFAVSHTYHLGGIIAFLWLSPDEADPATLVLGGLGFVFVFAMAATSFDRTAAALGPRRWKLLHKIGSYYLWLILVVTYLGNGHPGPRQLVFLGLLMAAMGVRITEARVRARTTA